MIDDDDKYTVNSIYENLTKKRGIYEDTTTNIVRN